MQYVLAKRLERARALKARLNLFKAYRLESECQFKLVNQA